LSVNRAFGLLAEYEDNSNPAFSVGKITPTSTNNHKQDLILEIIKLYHLDPITAHIILDIICESRSEFSAKNENTGRTDLLCHEIQVQNNTPFRDAISTIPAAHKE